MINQVQPVSFAPQSLDDPQMVVRAKGADAPLPMPQGPALKGPPLNTDTGKPITNSPNGDTGADRGLPVESNNGFAGDPWLGASGLGDGAGPLPGWGIGGHGLFSDFWIRNEYLLWNIHHANLPPLVTTSPPTSLGVLGNPGTAILFGGGTADNEEMSGGRFTFGTWLDCNNCLGVEGSFFFLGNRSVRFNAASNGNPLLARPFFNADPNVNSEDAELIANPSIFNLPPLTGAINIKLSSELWNAEVNGLWNYCRGCCCRTDLIFGFRYVSLQEDLTITENLQVPLTSPTLAGETLFVNDHFETHNHFFGGQVGFRSEYNWRCWTFDVTAKCALGGTHQTVTINGATIITPLGGAPSAFAGGLLAQPTNIGHYSRDRFSVIPEVGGNISYRLNDHWRAFAGYDFLYWTNVVRPGDQIDRTVNGTQLAPRTGPFVGPARPAFTFKEGDFWAHGTNIGLEFRY
jgi:hypothetical protein